MIVQIKRQLNQTSNPYYEEFKINLNEKKTVAGILDYLNYQDDLKNIKGEVVRRIKWECSCMQKVCGSCAMVINGRPALACSTFIEIDKTPILTLEPLSKFPVVCDLEVDRSIILEYQKIANHYLSEIDEPNMKEWTHQYNVAKCMKCGLCLEVCPNYHKDDNNFFGAIFANESYLMHTLTKERKNDIKEEYDKYFASVCSKALACKDICPMKMQTLSSISYMNRTKKNKNN